MANYAVIENGLVLNTIVADSKEAAEEVTGKTCVEFNESNPATIGGTYEGGLFIPVKPYSSWVLDGTQWVAPTSCPDNGKQYAWDENTLAWVEIPGV